jgi:putative membrane protein
LLDLGGVWYPRVVSSQVLPALVSAAHVVGIASTIAFSALRLAALRRRDVEATRAADNGNGLAALLLYGSGLYRLFGELEKPLPFYTSNPLFWLKMGLLAVAFALEVYPQCVVLPWHVRASRKLPIEPREGQFERMFTLAAWQLPCLLGAVVSAALMSRGIGLAPSPEHADAAVSAPADAGQRVYELYCRACHQADGRGLEGRAAADFTASPGVLDKSDDELLRSMRLGRTGPIGTMPPMSPPLSEEQLREALSYVRSRFGPSGRAD